MTISKIKEKYLSLMNELAPVVFQSKISDTDTVKITMQAEKLSLHFLYFLFYF